MSELDRVREEIAQAKGALAYTRSRHSVSFAGDLHKGKSLYFALCGDAVKIGVSSDPDIRIETLQTGAPGKISLLAVLPKSGDKEAECHRRVEHLRIHGEWFRHTEEVDQLIRELS